MDIPMAFSQTHRDFAIHGSTGRGPKPADGSRGTGVRIGRRGGNAGDIAGEDARDWVLVTRAYVEMLYY